MKESKVGMGSSVKVLVLMGGVSSEREISLMSGKNVAQALREAGYTVKEFDIHELKLTPDMFQWADVIFPVLHGGYGEDGRLQELLENAHLRFVGPSSRACRLIMDKLDSKKIMVENGVATPAYAVLTSADAPIPEGFSLPLIVKPNSEGSTFGITLVETEEEWKTALETAFHYDKHVFVEEFIRGIEGTVGILDGKALPMIEIRYPGKIYDFNAKYTHKDGETLYLCPPKSIPESVCREAAEAALAYAKGVGALSLVRVDFMIRSSDSKPFILEGNALPGMTNNSLIPKAAAAVGISMPELCASLVRSAYAR